MITMTDVTSGLPDPQGQPEFYEGVVFKRALAWLVDVTLIALITAVTTLVLLPLTLFASLFFIPATFAVLSFLYRWTTLAQSSATPGMKLAAVEIRDRAGRSLDSAGALLHTTGYALSVMIFPLQLVSIALMLISERRQGLTDHVLGTAALNPVD